MIIVAARFRFAVRVRRRGNAVLPHAEFRQSVCSVRQAARPHRTPVPVRPPDERLCADARRATSTAAVLVATIGDERKLTTAPEAGRLGGVVSTQRDGGTGRMVIPVSRCSASIRSARSVSLPVSVTA